MKNTNLITPAWMDYELLDSGDNRKLERYGKFIIARPETQAIWKPAHPELWKQATAEFEWSDGKGKWRRSSGDTSAGNKAAPESWQLAWNDIQFSVRLTSFKHTGVFPEQAANWEWIKGRVEKIKQPRVLNLFGYTGIASVVAAKSGAQVTHVDASKQSNEWAKENARLSGIGANDATTGGNIKFLLDDALKFVEREVRRGAIYDGIILDPPAFGRGAKGEVWHIEEQLPRLLDALAKLLAQKPGAFFLLNGYAAGYSPQSFLQAVESSFKMQENQPGAFGELGLQESKTKRIVPQGIYVRFMK